MSTSPAKPQPTSAATLGAKTPSRRRNPTSSREGRSAPQRSLRAVRSYFQLFPAANPYFSGRSVQVRLGLALVLGWVTGIAVYWFANLGIADGTPWLEALAWSAVGITQFTVAQAVLSWAGQWIISSTLGWSLGWLIGWSLHWNSEELVLGDAVWTVMGAIAYTIGALLVSAFRRESVETKTVTITTAAVSGAAVGYGLWYTLGDALQTLWPLVFSPLAIYSLSGLAITVLYLSLFNRHLSWYMRIGFTVAIAVLLGGISWGIVGAARWLNAAPLGAAEASWLRAGNLAGVLAGIQIAIAIESVRRRQWKSWRFVALVLAIGILGGTLPALSVMVWGSDALAWVGSLTVLIPLPLWLWLYENEALILQLSSPDRRLADDALHILRRRGWAKRPLLRHATLKGANLSALDLAGFNLSGARLIACDLSRASLKSATLQGTDLSGTLLIGCNLAGANLAHVRMQHAILTEALLSGANFRGTDLSHTDLQYAIYDSATLWPQGFEPQSSGAIGPGAALRSAILSGIDLSGCDLSGATLIRADLSHARLVKANLRDTNLRAADLKGADLSGAQLQGAILKDARFDETTQWPSGFNPVAAGAVFVKRLVGTG